jgi:threonine dehydrogenase-like Zn-dependent dehydrogenase
MRVLSVRPGQPGTARLDDAAEPPSDDGALLVRAKRIGICGTDAEIVAGKYGTAPPGAERLIIGHESLGEVVEAQAGAALAAGDLVACIVRRPDPVPCASCAAGEWDMCRNGLYTERGIKGRHGYAAERFRVEPEFAIKVDPALGDLGVLVEPASVVAKEWEQVERIGARDAWRPKCVLVTGAGPIGLLAALMAAQRGLELHVFDRTTEGPKPLLVRDLGGAYHTGDIAAIGVKPDIVMECTGASTVIVDVVNRTSPGGIVCLAGMSSGGHVVTLDVGLLNRSMVLENDVIFGSVNANRRHYEQGASALARAERGWLARLVTRRVPLARWPEALVKRPGDVKVVLDFEG